MISEDYNWANIIADKIAHRIGKRKLIIRFEEKEVEKVLLEKYGIQVAFRVTRAVQRADNVKVFLDSVIAKNPGDYFLVISHELMENNNDIEHYRKLGLDDNSIFFINHKPLILNDVVGKATDEFYNTIDCQSKATIEFTGYNSSVFIGKNCKVPKIRVGSNTKVVIGDGCRINTSTPKLATNTELIIGNNVSIDGAVIFINTDSAINIGDSCTIQTGRFRTGRNQKVVIGNDCMFSWDITLIPHDGHLIWDVNSGQVLNNTSGKRRPSVIIGNHVWIGGESALSAGTNIGDGSIVGFRSFVNKTFPNNVVIAGQPAKIVKKDIAWSRENYTDNPSGDFEKINPYYKRKTEFE